MAKRYRTGDLFLASRFSIDSILTRAIDREARWTEVGIIDVINQEKGDDIVSVFILTKEGAKLVLIDTILRDPTIESAAHRSIRHRDRNIFVPIIKSMFTKFVGSTRQSIVERSMNADERVGYTPSEFTAMILSELKLLSYADEYPISNFQEGGALDDVYDQETKLYPRQSNLDVVKSILELAHTEADTMILEYIKSKSNNVISVNNGVLNYEEKPVYDGNPTQMSSITKPKSREAARHAESTASDSLNRRLRKQKKDSAVYDRPSPTFK